MKKSNLKSKSEYMLGLFTFLGVFMISTLILTNFTSKGTYSADVDGGGSSGSVTTAATQATTKATTAAPSSGDPVTTTKAPSSGSCEALNAECKAVANNKCGTGGWTGCTTCNPYAYACLPISSGACIYRTQSKCETVEGTACTKSGNCYLPASDRCASLNTTCRLNAASACGANNWSGCDSCLTSAYKCIAQCSYGDISVGANGGYSVKVTDSNGKSLKYCCENIGWTVSGSGCYTDVIVRNDNDQEYKAYRPTVPGECMTGYYWNSSLGLCMDRICDCDKGECDDIDITYVDEDGTPYTPITPTPTPTPTTTKSGATTTKSGATTTKAPGTVCYQCTVSSSVTKYVYASSASSAASACGTSSGNCQKVADSYCESADAPTVNPKTGTTGVIIAWLIGISAICYSLRYFKRIGSVK